jgi:hypothetical protein
MNRIIKGLWRSSARRELSMCIECRGELSLEFSEKIESLKTLENSVRWALNWCMRHRRNSCLGEEKCLGEDLYRVTEHTVGSARTA